MEKDKSQVGDKFQLKDEWYEIALAHSGCLGCAFCGKQCKTRQKKNIIPKCFKSDRVDNRFVIFKKVK